MRNLFENHRIFETTSFIFKEGGTATAEIKVEKGTSKAETGAEVWELPEVQFNPEDPKDSEKVWKLISDKYDPKPKGPYEKMINDYVDKELPEYTTREDKRRLISDSVDRFGKFYHANETYFFHATENIKYKFDLALEGIETQAKNELALLKESVEANRAAVSSKKSLEEITEDLTDSLDKGKLDKAKVKDRFTAYVDALNGYYFNKDWQEAHWAETKLYFPIVKPNVEDKEYQRFMKRAGVLETAIAMPIFIPHFDTKKEFMEAYEEKGKTFTEMMKKKTEAKLDYLLSLEDATPETLKKFQKEIEDEYKRCTGLDKKKGFIDLGDLVRLEHLAFPDVNLLVSVQKRAEKHDEAMMEAMFLMNNEKWEESIETATRMLLADVRNNGTEGHFLEGVNKYREEEGKKPVSDFDEAVEYFEELTERYSKIGVHETYEVLTHFNKIVYGERMKKLDKIEPDSFRIMVYRERSFLLSRRLVPKKRHERLIVEFVSTGRKGRESILKNRRAELFKTIRNIQEHYSAYYKNHYKTLQRDLRKRKPVINSNDLENPHSDEIAARVQAFIMLADESEGIVKNFDTSDTFKGKGLAEQLNSTHEDEKAPGVGLKDFKDTQKSKFTPYASELSRGGFNGRDLGIKGLKILGVITFIANVANSIKAAKGNDIFDRTANAVSNIVTNPAVLASAGVAVGAHTLEMNKEFIKYPFASEQERMGMVVRKKLKSIQKKRPDDLRAFLNPGAPARQKEKHYLAREWRVMEELDHGKIKSLVDQARKKPVPMITNDEIEKSMLSGEKRMIMSSLLNTDRNSRTRFLFYEKFLYGEKPNIGDLKEHCVG